MKSFNVIPLMEVEVAHHIPADPFFPWLDYDTLMNFSVPADTSQWSAASLHLQPTSPVALQHVPFWIPKDRQTVTDLVDIYFRHYNIHRPIYRRAEFQNHLDGLYSGEQMAVDPGLIYGLLLMLALVTMELTSSGANTPICKTLPGLWPTHREIFARSMAIRPCVGTSISSLQCALLLLWYLANNVRFQSLSNLTIV
jgi:hypothetical protein